MRYTVRKSFVEVVGTIWMPAVTCSLRIDLGQWEIDQIADRLDHPDSIDPAAWREALDDWLTTHSGDFQSVDDFAASIEYGDATIDIPWGSEAGEMAYCETRSDW